MTNNDKTITSEEIEESLRAALDRLIQLKDEQDKAELKKEYPDGLYRFTSKLQDINEYRMVLGGEVIAPWGKPLPLEQWSEYDATLVRTLGEGEVAVKVDDLMDGNKYILAGYLSQSDESLFSSVAGVVTHRVSKAAKEAGLL